jgi:hypothetical protein
MNFFEHWPAVAIFIVIAYHCRTEKLMFLKVITLGRKHLKSLVLLIVLKLKVVFQQTKTFFS